MKTYDVTRDAAETLAILAQAAEQLAAAASHLAAASPGSNAGTILRDLAVKTARIVEVLLDATEVTLEADDGE